MSIPTPSHPSLSPSMEAVAVEGPLVFVSTYSDFSSLAHRPSGIESDHSILSFRMSRHDGSLTLMSVVSDVTNAAFMRYSPRHNILYVCTEAITEHGSVIAFRVDNATGILTEISRQSAGGSSTCYLTIDKNARHMLLVNYWDATIGVMPLTSDGRLLPLCEMTHPTGGPASNEVLLAKRSNHSNNDSETQKNRQSDPHSHAVVLDPYAGRIAYVPDLGMDCIHQFTYDPRTGTLHALKPIPCAPTELGPHGPRYIEFHPWRPLACVVNELSSTISLFRFNDSVAKGLVDGTVDDEPTLELIQVIKTIPEGFPGKLNTCGRIHCHPSGQYVLVSNRGHDSIAVLRLHPSEDRLVQVGWRHTRGRTPRHFQFDPSGQHLIVANQDTNTVKVFLFNMMSGSLSYTGAEFDVASPNFICCDQPERNTTSTDITIYGSSSKL